MEFINYIRPELLIVAVICYLVGAILKKTKWFKDNFIPLAVGGVGIVACILYCGFEIGWSFNGIVTGAIQGILCGAASTYVDQVIKQIAKNNNIDEKVVDEVIDAIKGDDKND